MNTLNLASIAIILKIPCLRLATILLVFAMGKLSNLFECVCFGVFYLSRTYSCISQCNTIFNKPLVLLRAHLSGLSITTKNNKKSNCVGQLIPKQCPTLFFVQLSTLQTYKQRISNIFDSISESFSTAR